MTMAMPEVMAMIRQIRGHMKTMSEVKSEWLNGLESVLVKKIKSEKKIQPRITIYFSKPSHHTNVICNNNCENNSNDEIHFIGT